MGAAQSGQSQSQSETAQDGGDDHRAAGLVFGAASKVTAPLRKAQAARKARSEGPPAPAAGAVRPAGTGSTNPYGGAPGGGISVPDYYRPTPSVKNATTYFPQSEELGPDEMRVTFMGTCPVPPKRDQASTSILVEGMKEMTRWNTTSYSTVPTGRGFEVEVNEFDFADDGGICYQQDGVTVRHWRRIHNMSGATGYRLDWNGLSFVWTGDGRPDEITIEQCQGVDLFVTELQLDAGALVALKSGVPEVIYDLTIDLVHTDHYATGYMMNSVNPRMGMVTHTPYDHALVNECIAGVRTYWDGLFGFGAPNGVVANITKDAVWTRQSAWPEAANPRPASTPDELDAAWGNEPREIPAPAHEVTDLISKERLGTAIPYDRFVPADVDRQHRSGFPPELVGTQIPGPQPAPSRTDGKPAGPRATGTES